MGESGVAGDTTSHAFIYQNGAMTDISPAGWSNTLARAINDNGQIVGFGFNPEGQHAAFLLTQAFKAFVQQPINSDGSSIFKANRGVIPVKFTLMQNNTATCQLPSATISLTRTAGGVLGSVDEGSYIMAADNGSNFRVDQTACQYVYNLAASSLGIGTYRVDISINSVVVGSAVFALK